MTEISLTDMCRLCLSKDKLIWVFDKRFADTDDMKSVVFRTTDVEIKTTDPISQKICEKCCRAAVSLLQFRRKAVESDLYLKAQMKKLIEANNNEREIKEEILDSPVANGQESVEFHPTIRELYKLHPHIKLPRICLNLDVIPAVTVTKGVVEDYCKEHNINFEDYCRAVNQKNTARKKTSAICRGSPPYKGKIISQTMDEDEDNGVLRPIKIKIIPKDINKENGSELSEKTENSPPSPKRRKLDDDKSPTKENERPNTPLVPADPHQDNPDLSNVFSSLFVCSVCDTSHSSFKDLKKHRFRHMRCRYCKTSYRSFEDKKRHLKECLVRNTINKFPCIEVPKLEDDVDVVEKYQKTLTDLPVLTKDLKAESCEVLVLSSDPEDESSNVPQSATVPDYIEIFSDDDTVTLTASSTKPVKKIPAIKPNVRIKANSIIDEIGSNLNEVQILQNLLTCNKPLVEKTEKSVETDPCKPFTVEITKMNKRAVLSNFFNGMHNSIIPVEIKKGPFEVSYKQSVDVPKTRDIKLWSDSRPVDIKRNNTKVVTKSVDTDIMLSTSKTASPLPATVAHAVPPPVIINHNINSAIQNSIKLNQICKSVTNNDCSNIQLCENSVAETSRTKTRLAKLRGSIRSHTSVVPSSAVIIPQGKACSTVSSICVESAPVSSNTSLNTTPNVATSSAHTLVNVVATVIPSTNKPNNNINLLRSPNKKTRLAELLRSTPSSTSVAAPSSAGKTCTIPSTCVGNVHISSNTTTTSSIHNLVRQVSTIIPSTYKPHYNGPVPRTLNMDSRLAKLLGSAHSNSSLTPSSSVSTIPTGKICVPSACAENTSTFSNTILNTTATSSSHSLGTSGTTVTPSTYKPVKFMIQKKNPLQAVNTSNVFSGKNRISVLPTNGQPRSDSSKSSSRTICNNYRLPTPAFDDQQASTENIPNSNQTPYYCRNENVRILQNIWLPPKGTQVAVSSNNSLVYIPNSQYGYSTAHLPSNNAYGALGPTLNGHQPDGTRYDLQHATYNNSYPEPQSYEPALNYAQPNAIATTSYNPPQYVSVQPTNVSGVSFTTLSNYVTSNAVTTTTNSYPMNNTYQMVHQHSPHSNYSIPTPPQGQTTSNTFYKPITNTTSPPDFINTPPPTPITTDPPENCAPKQKFGQIRVKNVWELT